MFGLELPFSYFLFLPWCLQILANDTTVHYPPVFHLSYTGTAHAPSFLAIFLLSSVLHDPLIVLFLSNSILRLLAVCNIAELVVCWYILTVCINGCSLLSTYSFSFVISTTWASSFKSSFSPSFMGHAGDLCLPLGDVFPGWLSVFVFFFPVFTVLLGTSNSKTVSKYWYCQWSNC